MHDEQESHAGTPNHEAPERSPERVPGMGLPLIVAVVCLALVVILSAGSCRMDTSRVEADPAPRAELPVPAPARMGAEPEIRVRIVRRARSIKLAGPSSAVVEPAPAGASFVLGLPATLVPGPGDAVTFVQADGRERSVPVQGPLRLSASEPIRVGSITLDAPVDLIRRDDDGRTTLDAVAAMPMEQYIPGVLAKELYPGWPLACYQAQAVCARTYAMHERERARRTGRDYDVESTTRDQAFAGSTTRRVAIEAARTTRGRVLADAGEPLRTYYSSTCGGRAASARDTWPTSRGFEYNLAGPIQAHKRECPCHASPRHRWTVARPVDTLEDRFRAWGRTNGHPIKSIRGIKRIEMDRVNPVGRPASYRVTDRRGKRYSLGAEQLRVASNTGASGAPAITSDTRVSSGDVVVAIAGGKVTYYGRGFGHGVGLCQFGARSLAATGTEWPDILSHYYPGATIETQY